MQPHRSNAMHDAAAIFTVTLGHVAVVSLSWSWSHQTQRRACAAAFAHVDIKGRTPYNRGVRTAAGGAWAEDVSHRGDDRA